MKYHNITHEDMLNGTGIRVVLWVAGCEHCCEGCQNPSTWDCNNGLEFDNKAKEELFNALNKDYISGITFSGGDPLHYANRKEVLCLIKDIKQIFSNKDIWIYTGYTWEEIQSNKDLLEVVECVDVLVEGRFKKELMNKNYHWAGSTNQRVIDIQKTLREGMIILYEHY